jgi:hypothetical protein
MLLNVLRWVSFAALCASGALFVWVSVHVGFWACFVGGLVHHIIVVQQIYNRASNLSEDRHQAHIRLIKNGDGMWVMDRLVEIGERDGLPESLKAETQRLRGEVIRLLTPTAPPAPKKTAPEDDPSWS